MSGTLEFLTPGGAFPRTVEGVETCGENAVRVRLRADDGHVVALLFSGVQQVQDKRPLGMRVSAVARYTEGAEVWFELKNVDEFDDSYLAVVGPTVAMAPE